MAEPTTSVSNPPAEASGANLVYILYLASLIVVVTALIGVVMAYVNRSEAPAWVSTHYTFQIRTFWMSILVVVVGVLTTFVVVGFAILLAWCVWLIIRCIKGMKLIGQGRPHPNPLTWGI